MTDNLSPAAQRPPTRLTAALFYIALGSPAPARVAAFYQQALGYEVEAHMIKTGLLRS
jgi:hypothetical protein